MAAAITKDTRFIDKVTEQTYRVVWIGDRMVLLESDYSAQILTTTSALKTHFEALATAKQ